LQRPPLSPSTPVSGYQRVAQSPPVISESPAHAWPSPTHLHKSTYRLFEQHSPPTSNHLCGDAPSPPARGTRSAPVPLYPAPSRLLGPPATAASSTPAHWARPRAAGGRAGPGRGRWNGGRPIAAPRGAALAGPPPALAGRMEAEGRAPGPTLPPAGGRGLEHLAGVPGATPTPLLTASAEVLEFDDEEDDLEVFSKVRPCPAALSPHFGRMRVAAPGPSGDGGG